MLRYPSHIPIKSLWCDTTYVLFVAIGFKYVKGSGLRTFRLKYFNYFLTEANWVTRILGYY